MWGASPKGQHVISPDRQSRVEDTVGQIHAAHTAKAESIHSALYIAQLTKEPLSVDH